MSITLSELTFSPATPMPSLSSVSSPSTSLCSTTDATSCSTNQTTPLSSRLPTLATSPTCARTSSDNSEPSLCALEHDVFLDEGSSEHCLETTRLKNFLLYCLKAEYGMASIDKRCENWYHFDKLLRKLLRYEFYYCESACKGYMESQTDLDMHLDRPARALGLPPRVVRAMLKRSPVAVAFYGSDIDIFRRLSRGSIDVLISKLLGDRMMIEAVVTDSVDYAILLGRLMELQRKFFVSLDSATVYTLTQFGRDYEYFNLESKLETEIDGKIRQWKEKTASVWSTVTDGYRRLLQ